MPFEVMYQRGVSVSSHLYQDIPFSSERQAGLHKLKTLPAHQVRLLKSDFVSHQSPNNIASQHEEEPFESLEEMEAKTIGNLLPDENDLFSGLMDGRSNNVHANRGDEFEDFDLFSSGGGMELEGDDQGGCNGPLVGEHHFGEHPSRTLFVRNIKEVREAPNSIRNKLIEFYDVRGAEAALHAPTANEIGGKQIKLAAGYPGGARKGFSQGSELEQAEYNNCHSQSNSLSILHAGMANESNLGLHSAIRSASNTFMGTGSSHLSSSVPRTLSSPMGVVSTDNNFCLPDSNHSLNEMKFGSQYVPDFHPHSLPKYHDSLAHGTTSNYNGVTGNASLRSTDGVDRRHTREMNSNGHLMELNGGAFATSGNGNTVIRGHHYVLNNSNSYQQYPSSPMMWQNSPSYINDPHAHRLSQMSGFPRSPHHMMNGTSPIRHHVGSAPAINPSLWERQAFSGQSPDTSSLHLGSPSFACFPSSPQLHPMEVPSRNIFSLVGGNGSDMNTSTRQHSSQEMHMFGGRNSMMSMPTSFSSPNEGGRHLSHRRSEKNSHNNDRKQYELDLERILRGDDNRRTLMIKNIPNKYTSKMLLAVIDESCRGIYDFIYLPIDFKNKCNVGYAFINMVDPKQIVPFYKAFNGKKWEKFNSEKVATLAYARIQGKAALIAHFQNSSLMNEDKHCRPILFHTDGPNAGDLEPFPMGTHIRSRPGRSRTSGYEESHTQWSPSSSANGEESS